MLAKTADRFIKTQQPIIVRNAHFDETFIVTIASRDRWNLYTVGGGVFDRSDLDFVAIAENADSAIVTIGDCVIEVVDYTDGQINLENVAAIALADNCGYVRLNKTNNGFAAKLYHSDPKRGFVRRVEFPIAQEEIASMNVTVDFAIAESTVSKSSFMFQSMLAIADKLGATHILFGISFNGRYQAQLYVAGDFVNLFFVSGNEGYWSDSAFGYEMYAPVVVENAQLAVKTFEEAYTMQGDVTDRHITLEEGIEWLTRLGATDVRAIGDYLLSGIDTDGYAFLTDIREHALSSVIAHTPAQVEMVDGQYETYAQYADRLDNLRNGAPIDALQAKLEGYALIQLEHAHSVLPEGTAEFMAVQEELKRRESLPYVWSIQYFTSQGLEEARELEEYATLAEIRACMADIHTSHWEYHVSADGLQKVMYSSQLDFGFIHYVTRGGVIVAPYAYATPMEEGSVNLDQVPYDAQRMEEFFNAHIATPALTPTQQKLMGEQMEYWGNRFDCAWDRADYDDCEFCACYVVALQAIFGML